MITANNILNAECLYSNKAKVNPQFYIITRENGQKNIKKVDEEFCPYAYVPEDVNVHNLPSEISNNIKLIDNFHTSFEGKKLKKIIFNSNISRTLFLSMSEYAEHTYELDVTHRKRFIIDNNITFTKEQKICYIDIETNMGINIDEVDKEIISIAVYDSFDKKYYCFVWHPEKQQIDKQENTEIVSFTSEREMMINFFTFMKEKSFDVITGWFIAGFDMPYIINRAKKIGLYNYIELLSPLCDVKQQNNYVNSLVYTITKNVDGTVRAKDDIFTKIFGVEIVDLINIYDKLTYENRPDSLSLNSVAEHILKEGKIKTGSIVNMWNNNINDLIKYNIQDVVLCVKIDAKTYLTNYFFNVQQIIPMPLEDVMYNSRVLDYYILKTYHDKFAFPSKIKHEKEFSLGAFAGLLTQVSNIDIINKIKTDNSPFLVDKDNVFWYADYPKAKIYSDIVVFDFAGMYPNQYRTFNISPETIVEKNGDIKIDNVEFSYEKEGLIPKLIQKVLNARNDAKKQRDSVEDKSSKEYLALDNLQGGYKTILNSLFGSMGYASFRLYNPKILKSILYMARELLVEVNKILLKHNYGTIYSDTDSVFVQLNEGTKEEILQLEKIINTELDEYLKKTYKIKENYMSMDCEKIFKNIIFTGVKKAYVGLLKFKKGYDIEELFSRGLSIVRKDSPTCIKELLKIVYTKILMGEDLAEIRKFLDAQKKIIVQLPLMQIGITKNISKSLNEYINNAQHVRAAKFSNIMFNTSFGKGDSPKMIFVKNLQNDAIMIDEDTKIPNDLEVDYEKFFELTIINKLKMFNTIKNLNIAKLYSMDRQLDEFMK